MNILNHKTEFIFEFTTYELKAYVGQDSHSANVDAYATEQLLEI